MSLPASSNGLRTGQSVGKYRLISKLGEGGSGSVWKARDTIEGIIVALKIPFQKLDGTFDDATVRKEVRLVSSLRHANIMPVKNADFIEGKIVLATELSVGTLDDRHRPMSPPRIIAIMEQVLEALAYAHSQRVVHCDVTPGNIFLFPDGRAALGDFGISRYQRGRIVTMDEFGTPGYVAPEQAYGKPTFASDCFAAGVILYEFITGHLPHWPFEWPLRRHERLLKSTSPSFVRMIRKALEINPRHRYRNADEMLAALSDVAGTFVALNQRAERKKKNLNWRRLRREAFRSKYGKILQLEFHCASCGELIAECMNGCPWCGETANSFDQTTPFPRYCPDCHKGVLPEWHYCPWCYGPGFTEVSKRRRPDKRYRETCRHCHGKLMPFMSYCPWCHRKVRRPWRVHPFPDACGHCRWSVDTEFWTHCPWCVSTL